MVFGKPRARRPDRRPLAALCLCLCLAGLSLLSCGPASDRARAAAFSSALGSLDSLLGSQSLTGLDAAMGRAMKLARASSDWLSILKRARRAESAGRKGIYAQTADRARRAFPGSEPLAAAAAHAYLRSGRGSEAFALFAGTISPEARPSLWAEAFLASRGSAPPASSSQGLPIPAKARPSDYGRFAEITGEAQAYLGAAVTALAAGDRVDARGWLGKGLAGGAHAPPELLWDCGFYEELAARSDIASGAGELAMMGDAAWMSGDSDLARRRWERSIALAPTLSWKAYVKLALLSPEGEKAESYWSRLRSAFLSGPASPSRDAALQAYAVHLSRQGRVGEALALLGAAASRSSQGAGGIELLAAMLRGGGQPEGRLAADLERIAAERPQDPEVAGAVLRSLAQRGLYEELSVLREGAARRKLPLEYGWYYEALVLAAREDFKGAAAAIVAAGNGAGTASNYALGSLYAAMGDSAQAIEALTRAADSAGPGRDRCAAYKALGRAFGGEGDAGAASRAFRAAAQADPRDAEAAILARGSLGKN
jgi:tetratricopeptide (TPR) repeat protein